MPDVRSADLGLILAEGLAYSQDRSAPKRLAPAAFAQTLSFAYAEGLSRYGLRFAADGTTFEQLRSGWQVAREFVRVTSEDLSPAIIGDMWTTVLLAVTGDGIGQPRDGQESWIVDALRDVRATGRVERETWNRLAGPMPVPWPLLEEMDGPRERRVKVLEAAIRELPFGSQGTRKLRAFLGGYIASRIEPGTLEHYPLLLPVVDELPESLLWYGACSGLTPETSLDDFGNGLGLLLRREFERPSHWLDRPECDIAVSELEVLLKNHGRPESGLQNLVNGILKVEIFPLVYTSIKWVDDAETRTRERTRPVVHEQTLFDRRPESRDEADELLRMIEESSKSLYALRRRVEEMFGERSSKGRKRQK
jgi:hypothetical protein